MREISRGIRDSYLCEIRKLCARPAVAQPGRASDLELTGCTLSIIGNCCECAVKGRCCRDLWLRLHDARNSEKMYSALIPFQLIRLTETGVSSVQ